MLEQGLQEQPIRILHLEDNPDDAEMCMRSLGRSGLDFSVKRVSKADEFKTQCEKGHYDVILGDYRLGGGRAWKRCDDYGLQDQSFLLFW